MKNRFVLIFSILFLLFISSVSAAQITQVNTNENGLEIEYPKYEALMQNEDFTLHVHVFNASGYPVTNSTVSCLLHLYNISGKHILESDMDYEGIEFELYINSNNFTKLGKYSYIIQCNNSKIGGFASGIFEVTRNGESTLNLGYEKIAAIIGFCFVSFIFLYLAFSLSDEHFLLKFISMFFSIFSLFSLAIVFYDINTALVQLYRIPVWFFRLFVMYFGGYLFFHWAQSSQWIMRMMK